jgi:hypothetical protein
MALITRTIEAKGFVDIPDVRKSMLRLDAFDGSFAKTKLTRAIKIKGKIALPVEIENEKLKSPKIYLFRKFSVFSSIRNMFQLFCDVEDDGSFEATVPENCQLLVVASCNNAATTEMVFRIPKARSKDDSFDLGAIRLKKGVSTTGIVLDRDNKPVEGQIVQLRQHTGENYLQNIVRCHVVSDTNGKFQLPPREGTVQISLVERAEIDGKVVKVKNAMLVAKPFDINLEPRKPSKEIEIRESRSWTVSGAVNCENGVARVVYSDPMNSQITIDVDKDGRFEFPVIDGESPFFWIYKTGGIGSEVASMKIQSLRRFRDHFSGSPEEDGALFQLKQVTSDIGPIEFEMVEYLPDDRSFFEQLFDWYYFGE